MSGPGGGERENRFPEVSFDTWRERVEEELGGGSFERRLVTELLEGIRIEPLYPSGGALPLHQAPVVGEGRWEVWTRIDAAAPEAASLALRASAARDAEGAWIVPGRALAAENEGADRQGVLVGHAGDLSELASAAGDDDLAIGLQAGARGPLLAVLWSAAASGVGIPGERLRGCFGGDPLGALASAGTLAGGLDGAMACLGGLASWAAERRPGMRAVRISTVPYNDAGADAVQELAFGLASGVEYLRALSADLPLPAAVEQLVFSFAVGRGFYLQVAKLRAARRLWSAATTQVLDGPARMVLHGETSWRTKTALDPWTNLLRTTVESMAAAVGGADAVVADEYDRALDGRSAHGRRLALSTQLLLREESQLHRVADPAAGSAYVEALSEALAARAWALFVRLEMEGGMAQALATGLVQELVEETASRRRGMLHRLDLPIVGTSAYLGLDEPWKGPGARREGETPAAVTSTSRPDLAAASTAVDAGFEDAVRAAAAGASVEEIEGLLDFGRGPTSVVRPLSRWRDAEPFEALRRATKRWAAAAGGAPGVQLVGEEAGPARQFALRALAAAGLRVETSADAVGATVKVSRGPPADEGETAEKVPTLYPGCDAVAVLAAVLPAEVRE